VASGRADDVAKAIAQHVVGLFPSGATMQIGIGKLADTIVGRVASVSAVAAASPEEQARVEAQVRELVREPEVDFPMITGVVVADRV